MLAKSKQLFVAAGITTLLSVAGCQNTDPLTRQNGDWRPAGVNQDNLAAEIENPADLTTGVADDGGDAGQAAAAIDRLRIDKVKTIEHIGLSTIGGGS